jgi:hypothetical protein
MTDRLKYALLGIATVALTWIWLGVLDDDTAAAVTQGHVGV